MYHPVTPKDSERRSKTLDTLRRVLTHRYLPVVLAVLGMTLTAPALWRGWVGDDLIHRRVLLSATLPSALKGLYTFFDPSTNGQLMDLGVVPWWTLQTVRVSFFRPLAVLSLWLDYQLWPNSSLLMHVHSILWYGAVCILATLMYRRFGGRTWAAGLAAFLFSVDIAHSNLVASLAARNGLLTVFFGLIALLAHDRWRREGWRTGALLAPLSLLLALLSAEAGVATAGYLAAHAIFLDRGTWRRRLACLAPYAAVVGIWRLVYQHLGFGAWGSGFYIDPGREPMRFLAGILEQGPLLLLGQWSGIDPALYVPLSGPAYRVLWVVLLLLVALVGIALVPLVRRDRLARFWGLGMMFAVVPVCGVSLPSGRLLLFVGLGAMGLMAVFITGLFDGSSWVPDRRAWRIPAWTLCFLLIGLRAALSPLSLPVALIPQDPVFRAIVGLGPLPEAETQDLVIVNMPSPGHSIYLPAARSALDQPLPAHTRILAPGYYSVDLTRVDVRTVVVRPEHGYLVPRGTGGGENQDVLPPVHLAYGYQHGDGLFRGGAFPMTLGQRVELTGMCAEVIALTDDGRPAEARIRFALPLEDPSLVWLQWDWQRNTYLPFALPDIGETVRVPGPF